MTSTPNKPKMPESEETDSRARTMARDLLATRTRWSAVSEVLQLISSTLVILMLARFLDEASYGVMGGVAALAMIVLNLSNLGSHVLLLRRGAQGEDLTEAWSRAVTIGVGLPALAAIALLILRPWLFPNVDATIYALFVIAGMPLFWLAELVVYLPVGLGHLKEAATARFIVVLCRMSAIGVFATFTDQSLEAWAWANLASFAAGGLLGVLFVAHRYNLRPSFLARAREDIRPGLPFSINGVTENLNDLADRSLLLRFDHRLDAGYYSLGGRAIQFAYMPLRMLLRAHDSEMFSAGKTGVSSVSRVSARLAPTAVLLGVGTGAAFWILAPLIPVVLGDRWNEAVDVVRWLAFLPGVRAVQYVVGNTLSAADRQWWRFGATAGAAVLNVGLNLWLLPEGSWRTAAATTFASEIFLMVALAAIVAYWIRREARQPPLTHSGD